MNPILPLLALLAGLGLPNLARAQMLAGGEFKLVGGAQPGRTRLLASEFTLEGGLATAASGALFGGPFALTRDFAGDHPATQVDPPELQLTRLPDGRIELSWPDEAIAYRLEFTTNPTDANAVWQPIHPTPSGTRHAITPDDTTRFFRLRAP